MAVEIFYICLGAGLLLFGAELYLPGGFAGVVGCLALISATVAGFFAYPGYGLYIATAIVLLSLAAFIAWLCIFPRTRLGKRMTVPIDLKTWKSTQEGLHDLLNQEGEALSELRPGGFARIQNQRIDVITRGDMIPRGARIRVIDVEGNRVTVAAVDPAPATANRKVSA